MRKKAYRETPPPRATELPKIVKGARPQGSAKAPIKNRGGKGGGGCSAFTAIGVAAARFRVAGTKQARFSVLKKGKRIQISEEKERKGRACAAKAKVMYTRHN